MSNFFTYQIPNEQAVMLVMGASPVSDPTVHRFTDEFNGDDELSIQNGFTSIQRAVWGARLRALADKIDP